jgi:hypothetical protein
MKSSAFWDVTPVLLLGSCLAYSSILKVETICSSESR